MKEPGADELISDYLRGNLTQTAREAFEQRLGEDAELASDVALRRAEMAAAELLIAAETRALFETWPPPRRNYLKPALWVAGITVAFALLMTVLWLSDRPDAPPPALERPAAQPPSDSAGEVRMPSAAVPPEKPTQRPRPNKDYFALARQFAPDPLRSTIRHGSADSAAGPLRRAQAAYGAGDYASTLRLLVQTDSAQQQSAAFLSAHALFQLQRFEEAEAQFSRLVERNSRQYRLSSEWGIVVCRLAVLPLREKEFRTQLENILAKPEHPYFEQAKKLEREINRGR